MMKTENDFIRSKARLSFLEALKLATPANGTPNNNNNNDNSDKTKEGKVANSAILEGLAHEIEKEMFLLFNNTGKEYKNRFRTLLFNLKDPRNPELRNSVVAGTLSPQELCKKDVKELANKELAEYRRARDEKSLDNLVIKDDHPPATLLIKNTVRKLEEQTLKPTSSELDAIGMLIDKERVHLSAGTNKSRESNPSSTATERSTNSNSNSKPAGEARITSPPPAMIPAPLPPALLEPIDEIPSFTEFEQTTDNDVNGTPDTNSNNESKAYIWNGLIKASSCKLSIRAQHVNGYIHIDKHIPSTLTQVGRMDLQALYKYLSQISFSSSRSLTLITLEPESTQEISDYINTAEALQSSSRAAVLKPAAGAESTFIKEIFMVPFFTSKQQDKEAMPEWAQGLEKHLDRLNTDSTSSLQQILIAAFVTNKVDKKDKSSSGPSSSNKEKRKSREKDSSRFSHHVSERPKSTVSPTHLPSSVSPTVTSSIPYSSGSLSSSTHPRGILPPHAAPGFVTPAQSQVGTGYPFTAPYGGSNLPMQQRTQHPQYPAAPTQAGYPYAFQPQQPFPGAVQHQYFPQQQSPQMSLFGHQAMGSSQNINYQPQSVNSTPSATNPPMNLPNVNVQQLLAQLQNLNRNASSFQPPQHT
jgi:hypothetical protein